MNSHTDGISPSCKDECNPGYYFLTWDLARNTNSKAPLPDS